MQIFLQGQVDANQVYKLGSAIAVATTVAVTTGAPHMVLFLFEALRALGTRHLLHGFTLHTGDGLRHGLRHGG